MIKPLTAASVFLLACATTSAAQSGAVYAPHDRVNAALAKGGVLVTAPQVHVAGVHRDTIGALDTQKGTSILYITEGAGMFAAGARSQRLTKGDVLVVPAGTAQAFTSVSSPISYLQITVPVMVKDAKAEIVYADHDKVAATMKKAAPLADGPNLRVSGGFRPFASADASPVAEVHANEADSSISGRDARRRCSAAPSSAGRKRGRDRFAPRKPRRENVSPDQGDVMWLPAGTPHWFPEIPEALGYLLGKCFTDAWPRRAILRAARSK